MIAKNLLVSLPILTGILCLFIKGQGLRRNLVFLSLIVAMAASLLLFLRPPQELVINLMPDCNLALGLRGLAKFIIIFVNLFGLLVCMYSKGYAQLKDNRFYFFYLAWLIAFSNLICLSLDFILFIFSWGATLALLYALLSLGSGQSAKKALSIVGLADFSLILGICLYIFLSGSTDMPSGQAGAKLVLSHPLSWASFLLMFIGALGKAGCMPLHTWIPQASETTSPVIMAILPAALDKLLGIYLLARICTEFFILNSFALGLMLLIGSFTIIFAVAMALVQHDLRKLLAYHSISQVGYMVIGFGTGNAIGIAAGIFHMVNNAIYKSGLFLTGASVGEKEDTFELEKLGGLAAYMPVTFICGLIFSLSISGIPPFNGFASKWMLYQGAILGFAGATDTVLKALYIFALIAAMFGSALTLASFIKFIHAIFLGEARKLDSAKLKEVSANMKVPVVVLAGLCILLGVFPYGFLKNFLEPGLKGEVFFIGSWNSVFSFFWLAIGLLFGLILYMRKGGKNLRADSLFIGGEGPAYGPNFPATEFYKTIEELPLVKKVYQIIRLETLDLYRILGLLLNAISGLLFIFVDRAINLVTGSSGYIVLGLSWVLRRLHSGVLDLYLAWSLFGLAVIFFILMAR